MPRRPTRARSGSRRRPAVGKAVGVADQVWGDLGNAVAVADRESATAIDAAQADNRVNPEQLGRRDYAQGQGRKGYEFDVLLNKDPEVAVDDGLGPLGTNPGSRT